LADGEQQPAATPITSVRQPNPDYIPDTEWEELQVWVHNWFMQRIPEEHTHLVEDVREDNLDELIQKCLGLAARNPPEYCQIIKKKMKGLTLNFEVYDLVAHQWTIDQFDMYDTIQDAKCMGEYKMATSEFVENVIDTIEPFMPTFAGVYRVQKCSH
jgi:hypothetical protein